jgi:hypothetical protein
MTYIYVIRRLKVNAASAAEVINIKWDGKIIMS